MKKLLFHPLKILAVLLFTLTSCNKDDEPEKFVDLEVDLTYTLVSQSSPTQGVVRIMAHIKNVGNRAFNSDSSQQLCQILERPLGASNVTVLTSSEGFTTLNLGQEITFYTDRNWSTSIEFQPDYIVRLTYDPDILMDGNSANDDSNSSNNTITVSGYDFNDLFN